MSKEVSQITSQSGPLQVHLTARKGPRDQETKDQEARRPGGQEIRRPGDQRKHEIRGPAQFEPLKHLVFDPVNTSVLLISWPISVTAARCCHGNSGGPQ